MSSPLWICQILHPAPEDRLQTVTEIKKSRLFDGMYVTFSFIKLFDWWILKEIGRKWHAGRYIRPSYLNLCGKAKWRVDRAGIEGCWFILYSNGSIYVPRLLLSRYFVGSGWHCYREEKMLTSDSTRLSTTDEGSGHFWKCFGITNKRHGFQDQQSHSYLPSCTIPVLLFTVEGILWL